MIALNFKLELSRIVLLIYKNLNFCAFLIHPIQGTFPILYTLSQNNPNKPISDKMFAKFLAYEDNGVEILNAEPFYNLLGGQTFKNNIAGVFNIERLAKIENVDNIIEGLSPLIGHGDQLAFLNLKMHRNRVAHNYISGLSDSFEDVRNFYYDALLYIVALENTLDSLTNHDQT